MAELTSVTDRDGHSVELGESLSVPPAGLLVADDPVFVYDAQGRCQWVNRSGQQALRAKAGRIVGRYIFDLFPADSRLHADLWQKMIDGGEPSSFVSEIDADGESSNLQTTLYPVMGAGGTVQSVISVGRILLESEVLLSENQMQAADFALVHDIASIMASSLDISEVYERFADEFKKLISFERILIAEIDVAENSATHTFVSTTDELRMDAVDPLPLAGSGIEWVVNNRRINVEDDLSRSREFSRDENLADRGVKSVMRVPVIARSGLIAVLSLSSSRAGAFGLRDQEIAEHVARQIAPAFENARLYEEVQEALESLRSAQEQLVRVERLRAMGELANGVAHDFNNALASILGQAQLLIKRVSDESHLKSLQMIEQSALDSARLVGRILDFARFETDTAYRAVDVNRIVEDSVALTRHKWRDEAQSSGRSIRVETRLGEVPPASGSYAELREMMIDLIVNAYEAIADDGSIEVATRSDDDRVHVSVTDTGVGMSAEASAKIFEPFVSTKGRGGTGLGMSVTFGVISRHNGTIDVESQEGQGTTVHVSLPRALEFEEPAAINAPMTMETGTSARILVVEDEPLIRETMADVLSQGGHRVTLASEGEEGLRLFKQDEHDIVFTDLSMPGLSGWQVAAEIKRHRSDVPVVIVTGWGVLIDDSEIEASGVDGVLAKPFTIETVLGLIDDLLGGVADVADVEREGEPENGSETTDPSGEGERS